MTEYKNAFITFPAICPLLAIWINILSIIFAFSGLTSAILFTDEETNQGKTVEVP